MQNPVAQPYYCVGFEIDRNSILACLSKREADGIITIENTYPFANKASSFPNLLAWLSSYCGPNSLPIQYVIIYSGIHHGPLAWYLFNLGATISILLPTKVKFFLKSSGLVPRSNNIRAYELAQIGLEQCLPVWRPLSKNIYTLRSMTRQYQRLQELKEESEGVKHSAEESQESHTHSIQKSNTVIQLYEKKLIDIVKSIDNLLAGDAILKQNMDRLCAIKGLDLLTVSILIAETNGFAGFDNVRQLVSFAGYGATEDQNVFPQTSVLKKGNSRIRRALFLPSLNAVRLGDPICMTTYSRVYERSRIKVMAYTAVQKKLLTLCFALWKSGAVYDPDRTLSCGKQMGN